MIENSRPSLPRIEVKSLLLGLSFLGFVSLGLPDGLLGVAWPSLRASFQLPLDALGPLLALATSGYLISSFSSGRMLARINLGALLAWSCLATSISLLGYAFAPVWAMIVALALLSGLGAGAIDAGLNTYAATHFSARAVNWLHACYGIGATAGPVLMTAVLGAGHPWQAGYEIVGMSQLALAMAFGCSHKLWANGGSAPEKSHMAVAHHASHRDTLRLPLTWLSIAVFFIYTGIEAAAGAWSYSLFTASRAVPMKTAGAWVSVYWGCLTAGRLLAGVIVSFVSVRMLLRLGIMGIGLGAALMWLAPAPGFGFVGLAWIGLSCAPIFPMLIAGTPARMGATHAANAVGYQIAAAGLGQALIPGFVGGLARRFSLEAVAPALLIAAVLLWLAFEAIASLSPRETRAAV